MVEIWLSEPYFEEFADRRGVSFTDAEAKDVYIGTQDIQKKWPITPGNPLPNVGNRSGLYYAKYDWPTCRLRICFGARTEVNVQKIIALTCRTKQELSKGSSDGTKEWYKHMATVGMARWDEYRRGKIRTWKIY